MIEERTMKALGKLFLIILAPLVFASGADAKTPREELKQMVEQLQKTPTDNALREKIIKFAQVLKPAPPLPEEALRYEGRARAAFQTARQESDYLEAAREYQSALLQAPWVAGYYADLCTIYEKATIYAEARRSCQWALMAERDAAAVTEIKRRIAGLDFLIEKFSKDRLSARPDQPFSLDIPGMPAGNRWFCRAAYNPKIFRMFANPGDPAISGREELWFVYDGAAAFSVSVAWVESESLAAWVLKRGLINPLVSISQEQPHPSAPRQFYSEGITSHYVSEISADGQTVSMVQRAGPLAEPREEQYRWSCMRK
jgi:hypothetical protein